MMPDRVRRRSGIRRHDFLPKTRKGRPACLKDKAVSWYLAFFRQDEMQLQS
jgi:hypothetical protein